MNKEVLILKNDRIGDLFVSLGAINKIINKHSNDHINIFLSDVNHKFNFLFPRLKKKIFSMNLSIMEKFNIFFYLLSNDIKTVYILTPKNFFYYLPLFFKKIKFYGIAIKSKKNRPNNFLLKYLYKFVVLDRTSIKKRHSSYNIQENLIETTTSKNFLNEKSNLSHNFNYPNKFIIFHYKKSLFEGLLGWSLKETSELIDFLNDKYDNLLFSSEIHDDHVNDFFSKRYNTFDYTSKKTNLINNETISFLKNIDGYDLFDVVKRSSRVICPEGILTHMGYFLNKDVLALMHFKLNNREDYINQIISCKEWFPPKNYQYTVLKKNLSTTFRKLEKRL
jgi:ADP-heptose:LPS heptosyltransferase